MQYQIFTDGGSRGNPGLSAGAFVVYDGDTIVYEEGKFFGHKTNNEAEYLAVLSSLRWLKIQENLPTSCTWYLDSLLVVEQISGSWKVKEIRMKILKSECLKILGQIFPQKTYEFKHIPREENERADALVNLALDQQAS